MKHINFSAIVWMMLSIFCAIYSGLLFQSTKSTTALISMILWCLVAYVLMGVWMAFWKGDD